MHCISEFLNYRSLSGPLDFRKEALPFLQEGASYAGSFRASLRAIQLASTA